MKARRILYPFVALVLVSASLAVVGPAAAACTPGAKSVVVEATSENVKAIVACGAESVSALSFGPAGTLSVAIPPAGEGLTLLANYPVGATGVTEARVVSFKDGGIGFEYQLGDQTFVGGDELGVDKINAELAATSSPTGAAARASGCSSSSYATMPYFQVGSYHYSINLTGMPSGGVARINAAATRVGDAYDNCGLPGTTGVPAVYDGTTTYTTNVTFSGGCATQDGQSVQKFGNLSSSVAAIAITCVGYSALTGWVIHTDTVYKNGVPWSTLSGLTGCSGAYDLQGVATHEMGHVYGLNHAGDATQVMYASSGYCDTGDRLLGSGDHAGLMAIY
jgi:hypothetical protein